MYLTALTHRDRLFDVATRWLSGRVEPGDARLISEIFLIDQEITFPTTINFLQDVMKPFVNGPTTLHRLQTKGEVRQLLIDSIQSPSARARELFSDYLERSESFFPTTPVDLHAVAGNDGEVAAMVRLKRVFRIADKATRKIVDRLDREIRGVSTETEVTEQVCRSFAAGDLAFSHDDLRIDDVIGAKLIGDPSQLTWIEAAVRAHPKTLSVRRSEHTGSYKDIHLDVTLQSPAKGPTIDRLRAMNWDHSIRRGLRPDHLVQALPDYVETGTDSFVVEILLTDREELVESEFGRGLHEERIIRQRTDPRFTSQLATNVGLSTLFLMLAAVSPTAEVLEVPITMNGRHLPDAIVGSMGRLFGLDLGRSPFWTGGTPHDLSTGP